MSKARKSNPRLALECKIFFYAYVNNNSTIHVGSMEPKISSVPYCVLIVFQINKKSRNNTGHRRNYSVKHEWNAKDVTQWNEHRGPCCH
jgi:hypothetical protein